MRCSYSRTQPHAAHQVQQWAINPAFLAGPGRYGGVVRGAAAYGGAPAPQLHATVGTPVRPRFQPDCVAMLLVRLQWGGERVRCLGAAAERLNIWDLHHPPLTPPILGPLQCDILLGKMAASLGPQQRRPPPGCHSVHSGESIFAVFQNDQVCWLGPLVGF